MKRYVWFCLSYLVDDSYVPARFWFGSVDVMPFRSRWCLLQTYFPKSARHDRFWRRLRWNPLWESLFLNDSQWFKAWMEIDLLSLRFVCFILCIVCLSCIQNLTCLQLFRSQHLLSLCSFRFAFRLSIKLDCSARRAYRQSSWHVERYQRLLVGCCSRTVVGARLFCKTWPNSRPRALFLHFSWQSHPGPYAWFEHARWIWNPPSP